MPQVVLGGSGTYAASLWERAGRIWPRLDKGRRAKRALRRAAQSRGDPVLDLEWIGDTAFCQGEASLIHLRVTNRGKTVAREIRVVATGPGFHSAESWRAELTRRDTWDCRLERLIPKCAGSATLHIEARCEAPDGRVIAYRWRFDVQVAPQGQPPTVINIARQFTGPAHVVAVEGSAGMVKLDGNLTGGTGTVEVGGDVGMVRSDRRAARREGEEARPEDTVDGCRE